MGRTAIRCTCGQRIGRREVTQTGLFPRPFGPSFVRIRFRCSRCRRRGEEYLRQEEWAAGILHDRVNEAPAEERQRFDQLGRISLTEQAQIHDALEADDLLDQLNAQFRTENEVSEPEAE